MTRPPLKEIAALAWEMRPTSRENIVIAVLMLAMVWLTELPWWVFPTAYVAGVFVVLGTLAWLELCNEAADGEDPEAGDG